MYRLTKWQRFWKLDVPSSAIGLVWNMMMSMGGGWFFLTASEAVTVFVKGKGVSESLPGMGSYMAAAVQKGSYGDVIIAIGVMVGVPVGVVFGRWLWDLFAHNIDVVPAPTVPVLSIVLIVLGAVVLANLVAAVPGVMAARTKTASLLRAE